MANVSTYIIPKESLKSFTTNTLKIMTKCQSENSLSSSNNSLPNDAIRPGGRFDVQGFVWNPMAKTFIKIYVSHFYNPDRFYFQLIDMQQRFGVLMANLQKFYDSNLGLMYRMIEDDVIIGLPIAAIYRLPTADLWHRAIISRISDDRRSVEVFYVDYGTKAIQPLHNIRFLKQQFLEFPAQAIRARLANVERPLGHSEWSPEAIEFCLSCVVECPLVCDVVGCFENAFSVKLCDTRLPDRDVYLADELIKKGMARDGYTSIIGPVVQLSSRSLTDN